MGSIMKVSILVVFALLVGFSQMKHLLISTKTGGSNNTKGFGRETGEDYNANSKDYQGDGGGGNIFPIIFLCGGGGGGGGACGGPGIGSPGKGPQEKVPAPICITDWRMRNAPCIFPLKDDGITFNECTWYKAHLRYNKPWCATEVTEDGGWYTYGNCFLNCPIEKGNGPR